MDRFFTIPQFLELYPMGRTTFYRLVESGQLTVVKFGRATRIAESDAIKWENSLPRCTGRGSLTGGVGASDA